MQIMPQRKLLIVVGLALAAALVFLCLGGLKVDATGPNADEVDTESTAQTITPVYGGNAMDEPMEPADG